MTAREALFSDVQAIRHAAQLNAVAGLSEGRTKDDCETAMIVDAASMLRRGLSVISFASFERFLSSRIRELVDEYNSSTVRSFSEIPPKLAARTRQNAIDVVNSRTKRETPQSEIDELLVSLARTLNSTSGDVFHLSATALSWTGSNIGSEDLKTICEALGCSNPFGQLTTLVRDLSDGQITADSRELFKNFAERRHLSAHDGTHVVSILESRTLYRDLLYLSLATDMLLTTAMSRLMKADRDVSSFSDFTSVASIHKLSRVPRGTRYRLSSSGSGSTSYKTPLEYFEKTRRKDSRNGRTTLVLVLDSGGIPTQILS